MRVLVLGAVHWKPDIVARGFTVLPSHHYVGSQFHGEAVEADFGDESGGAFGVPDADAEVEDEGLGDVEVVGALEDPVEIVHGVVVGQC